MTKTKKYSERPVLQFRVRMLNRIGQFLTRRGTRMQSKAHKLVQQSVEDYQRDLML